MELTIELPTASFPHTHKPHLITVELDRHYLHNIANRVPIQVLQKLHIHTHHPLPFLPIIPPHLQRIVRGLQHSFMYLRQIQRLLKSAVVRSQSIQQIQPIPNLHIAEPLLAQLPHKFLLTTAHTLSHQRQRLTHCLNRRVVVQQLRIHSAKLQVVTRQLLVHLQPRRVRRTSRVQSAALRRCLANEIVVVEDDTLEVIAAVIQLPQLLVNRSLIVQNCYYQLLTQVLP